MSRPSHMKGPFEPSVIATVRLSDKEDRICKVLIGMTYGKTVAAIARKAGVARTTTAYILNKFVELRIARKGRMGKRNIYSFNRDQNRNLVKIKRLEKLLAFKRKADDHIMTAKN